MRPQEIFNKYSDDVGEALFTPQLIRSQRIKIGDEMSEGGNQKRYAWSDGWMLKSFDGLDYFMTDREFASQVDRLQAFGKEYLRINPEAAAQSRRYLVLPETTNVQHNNKSLNAKAGLVLCDLGKGDFGLYEQPAFKRDNTPTTGTLKYDA